MYRLLALLVLLAGCMGNRMYHAHTAADWTTPAPATLTVEGEGVLTDRLARFIHTGCRTIKVVESAGDLRIVLAAPSGEFLTISCYRSGDNRLLMTRAFIWTSRTRSAVDKVLKEFVALLDKELTARFPAGGGR